MTEPRPILVSQQCVIPQTQPDSCLTLTLQEERAHVAVGIAWFKRVCLAMGVEVGGHSSSFQVLEATNNFLWMAVGVELC
eukprot:scaffold114708_cov24-Tisochrysis_lutea.AAC.1